MPYKQTVKPQVETIDFTTADGHRIARLPLTIETYGERKHSDGKTDKPVVVVLPHFLGSAHAAGVDKSGQVGHFDALVGPGDALDTERYHVISFAPLVHSGWGPQTLDEHTQQPLGSKFPSLTIGDFAAAMRQCLLQMGIARVDVLVGASVGSMLIMQMMFRWPEFVDRMVLFVPAGVKLAVLLEQFAVRWIGGIDADPKWNHGDYYAKDHPKPLATYARVLTEFFYTALFPLRGLVWGEPPLETSDSLPADVEQAMVEGLKALDLDAGSVQARTLQGVVKQLLRLDPNILLWQMRAIRSHDVSLRAHAASFEYAGEHQHMAEQPLEGKKILSFIAPCDHIMPAADAFDALECARSLGAQTKSVMLPRDAGHAVGLSAEQLVKQGQRARPADADRKQLYVLAMIKNFLAAPVAAKL